MGEYADIKSRRLRRFIEALVRKNPDLDLRTHGRHQMVLKCIHNGQSFPLPVSHDVVNKHIVKKLVAFLVENDCCTKEEFDRGV